MTDVERSLIEILGAIERGENISAADARKLERICSMEARAAENEACARIADEFDELGIIQTAIRARISKQEG